MKQKIIRIIAQTLIGLFLCALIAGIIIYVLGSYYSEPRHRLTSTNINFHADRVPFCLSKPVKCTPPTGDEQDMCQDPNKCADEVELSCQLHKNLIVKGKDDGYYCGIVKPNAGCEVQNGGVWEWTGFSDTNSQRWQCSCLYPRYFGASGRKTDKDGNITETNCLKNWDVCGHKDDGIPTDANPNPKHSKMHWSAFYSDKNKTPNPKPPDPLDCSCGDGLCLITPRLNERPICMPCKFQVPPDNDIGGNYSFTRKFSSDECKKTYTKFKKLKDDKKISSTEWTDLTNPDKYGLTDQGFKSCLYTRKIGEDPSSDNPYKDLNLRCLGQTAENIKPHK